MGCMLRRLYDWTISLARRPTAEIWLAFIAFVESSVFLVPADILFLPMAFARPQRAYRFALTATVASVLGGILGWMIGFYAFDQLAKPILDFYGIAAEFERMKQEWGSSVLLLLVTSGLAHLPPIKIVTILSGAVKINLWVFIASAIAARGARFFILAALIHRFGASIQHLSDAGPESVLDMIARRFGSAPRISSGDAGDDGAMLIDRHWPTARHAQRGFR